MEELVVNVATGLTRQAENGRNQQAALGRVCLPHRIWRSTDLPPLSAIPDVRVRTADIVVAVVVLGGNPFLIPGQHFRAIAIGTVIGDEQHDGVVQLARLLQIAHHTADIVVHVVDHGRVYFHLAGFNLALLISQFIPGGKFIKRNIG